MRSGAIDPQLQGLGISSVSAEIGRPANDHAPYIANAPEERSSQPEGNDFGPMLMGALGFLVFVFLFGLGLLAAASGLIDVFSGWTA